MRRLTSEQWISYFHNNIAATQKFPIKSLSLPACVTALATGLYVGRHFCNVLFVFWWESWKNSHYYITIMARVTRFRLWIRNLDLWAGTSGDPFIFMKFNSTELQTEFPARITRESIPSHYFNYAQRETNFLIYETLMPSWVSQRENTCTLLAMRALWKSKPNYYCLMKNF